jgi:hypothetical protein
MTMNMVTPFTIAELADEKEVKDLHPVLGFGAECYEAGMIEVLRMVAEKELEKHSEIKLSQSTKEFNSKMEYQYLLLKEASNLQQNKLLEEFQDQYEFLNGSENTDFYIAGFLQGYRYLKSERAHQNPYCPSCHVFID